MNGSRRFVVLLSLAVVLAACGEQPTGGWDEETLELAATLPIQDGGRVKPLSTYARFTLLAMNGRTSVKIGEEKKLSSLEWLLDCLFRPEKAEGYEVFLVRTSEVLDAIELPHEGKKKSDRYSYKHLEPGRARLFELYREYSQKEAKDRSSVEEQIVLLGHNLFGFERILGALRFASAHYPIDASPGLRKLFAGEDPHRLSAVLARAGDIVRLARALQNREDLDEAKKTTEVAAFTRLLESARSAARMSTAFAVFPPPEGPEWLAPAELFDAAFRGGHLQAEQIALLRELEDAVVARDDPARFREALQAFHTRLTALTDARGEYGKIELEAAYYRLGLFHWSLGFFVLAFFAVAISWLRPSNAWLSRVPMSLSLLALAFLVAVITLRCVIR
ncbi:MAG: hypothetical protein ACYTDY_10475, partial [Planctomycetota bacterium]